MSDNSGRVCSRSKFCGARSRRTILLGHSVLAGGKHGVVNSDLFCSDGTNVKGKCSGMVCASRIGGGVFANGCYFCGRFANCSRTTSDTITVSFSRGSAVCVRTSAFGICAFRVSASAVCHRVHTCRGMHSCHASIRTMYSSLVCGARSSYVAVFHSPVI